MLPAVSVSANGAATRPAKATSASLRVNTRLEGADPDKVIIKAFLRGRGSAAAGVILRWRRLGVAPDGRKSARGWGRQNLQERVLEMSGEFLWELEKLRRRFGVDAEELRLATRELTRKPRGIKEQRHTGEITLARKQRRASRELEYWKNLEELVDLVGDDVLKGKEIVDRLDELLRGDSIDHAVLLDFADCLLRRVITRNNISDSDIDHVERGRFHLGRMEGPDTPRRRKLLPSQISVLETLLRELRAARKTT